MLATAVAAPAFSASPYPGAVDVLLTWVRATWKPAATSRRSSLNVDYRVTNGEAETVTLSQIELHTTYHLPATNSPYDLDGSLLTLVDYWDLQSETVLADSTISTNLSFVPNERFPHDGSNPPQSLLPAYYNDFPTISDGTIDCLDVDTLPTSPSYPDSCKRLSDDGTFLRLRFTVGGQAQSVDAAFSGAVVCRVTGLCVGGS